MSKVDDVFYRQFGIVLIALTLFTLIVFLTARAIGGRSFEKVQNNPQAVLERIRPFGQVRVGNADEVVTAAASASAPATGGATSGEQVYSGTCIACHSTGVAGAPKTDDKAAWEPRLAQGLDALVMSSLKGKGGMPPKGGNTSLSDAEVKSAVEYILQKAGLMEAGTSAAPAPPAQASAAPPAAEAVPAAGQTGKAVYGKACIACHSTGAAGAPKLGDKAAWEPRTAQGLDTLVNSVLMGKGAMPAKGGNNSLSEDDIRKTVEFMVASAGPVTEAPAEIASAGAAGDSSGPAQPGDQVYMIACVNCHGSGVGGAPKVADRAAWASLETKGVDALVRSVIEGKGTMPAKGGSASLREDEIRGAVAFMLDAARFSATVTAATQPDTANAAGPQAAPSAEQVAATAPGQAGEAVYKKACIACHSTGAAGAPKVGDDAAWKTRAEKGIDTLVRNSLSGVGAMPPKGGNSALSDEEVRKAVLFMLEQSGGAR